MIAIYTSYHAGEQRGESISISLYPPDWWKGKHLPLFAPSKELFNAKLPPEEYTKVFLKELANKDRLIDTWLNKIEKSGVKELTLNCFKDEDFCHRHLVADVIRKKRPVWLVKEIGLKSIQPVLNLELDRDPPVINRLKTVSGEKLEQLKQWLETIKPYMVDSISSYAPGRKELHLRHFVKLKKASTLGHDEIKPIPSYLAEKYQSQLIEELGESLLSGFHQALVLYYPKGSQIGSHRDSPAYASGAASINLIGKANFLISDKQKAENMQSFILSEGDCILFDNKQPHAVTPVETDRWCVCFFYLKELIEKPVEQLPLFQLSKADPIKSDPLPNNFVNILDFIAPSLAKKEVEEKPRLNMIGCDGMPFIKPRYVWKFAPSYWPNNPYGEEVALDLGDKVILAYGGVVIPRSELIEIDPLEVAKKHEHYTIFNGQIIAVKDLLAPALKVAA